MRYNLGPGVAVELAAQARVAELKEVVGSQQGVAPQELRVLFAGRELQSSASLLVSSFMDLQVKSPDVFLTIPSSARAVTCLSRARSMCSTLLLAPPPSCCCRSIWLQEGRADRTG